MTPYNSNTPRENKTVSYTTGRALIVFSVIFNRRSHRQWHISFSESKSHMIMFTLLTAASLTALGLLFYYLLFFLPA
jgi:hypothetical protein